MATLHGHLSTPGATEFITAGTSVTVRVERLRIGLSGAVQNAATVTVSLIRLGTYTNLGVVTPGPRITVATAILSYVPSSNGRYQGTIAVPNNTSNILYGLCATATAGLDKGSMFIRRKASATTTPNQYTFLVGPYNDAGNSSQLVANDTAVLASMGIEFGIINTTYHFPDDFVSPMQPHIDAYNTLLEGYLPVGMTPAQYTGHICIDYENVLPTLHTPASPDHAACKTRLVQLLNGVRAVYTNARVGLFGNPFTNPFVDGSGLLFAASSTEAQPEVIDASNALYPQVYIYTDDPTSISFVILNPSFIDTFSAIIGMDGAAFVALYGTSIYAVYRAFFDILMNKTPDPLRGKSIYPVSWARHPPIYESLGPPVDWTSDAHGLVPEAGWTNLHLSLKGTNRLRQIAGVWFYSEDIQTHNQFLAGEEPSLTAIQTEPGFLGGSVQPWITPSGGYCRRRAARNATIVHNAIEGDTRPLPAIV